MSHTCRHGATFFILVVATGPTGGEPREPPTRPRKKRSRRGKGRLAYYSLAARHVINFAFDYRSAIRRFSPLPLCKSSVSRTRTIPLTQTFLLFSTPLSLLTNFRRSASLSSSLSCLYFTNIIYMEIQQQYNSGRQQFAKRSPL